MADLGIDGDTYSGDLDDRLSLSSGRRLLIADLVARLSETPGGLYYDRDGSYGAGLLDELNEGFVSSADIYRIQQRVVRQCLLDERVETADCTCSFVASTKKLHARITIDDGDGEFDLVLSVDAVTVEILKGG